MTATGRRIRVYADASVYGGVFDEEFDAASRAFFFRKIPLYNGVNLAQGYGPIAIHTPQEVIVDED